jgi:hypothetical protein
MHYDIQLTDNVALRSADEFANEQYKKAATDDSDTSGLKTGNHHYCDGLPSSPLHISVFSCLYTYNTGPDNTDSEDGDLVRVHTVLYKECAGINSSMSPDLPGEMYMPLSSLPCHMPCPSHIP